MWRTIGIVAAVVAGLGLLMRSRARAAPSRAEAELDDGVSDDDIDALAQLAGADPDSGGGGGGGGLTDYIGKNLEASKYIKGLMSGDPKAFKGAAMHTVGQFRHVDDYAADALDKLGDLGSGLGGAFKGIGGGVGDAAASVTDFFGDAADSAEDLVSGAAKKGKSVLRKIGGLF